MTMRLQAQHVALIILLTAVPSVTTLTQKDCCTMGRRLKVLQALATTCPREDTGKQLPECKNGDGTPECVRASLKFCFQEKQTIYNLTKEVRKCGQTSLTVKPLFNGWMSLVSVLLPVIRSLEYL
ncbi:hypothetical protein CSKR_103387 [Clonorchis sinensis]|uniref:Uncharacterized protein n=1 Tax=Clonorchis sinensis TaxID=79923 RepID=A0A8T1M8A6_CLOSI|nr:hypothetical protein CSKR_103387 [Clonorchis sinensis]